MTAVIAYVGAGTEDSTASGGAATPSNPTGLAVGDLLVVDAVDSTSSLFATSAISGFTRRNTSSAGGSAPSCAIFYRFVTSTSESGQALSITNPGAVALGNVFAYRNVDSSNPFLTDGLFSSSAAVTDYQLGTQTPDIIDCAFHAFVVSNAITGSWSSPPTSFTQRWTSSTGGTNLVAAADLLDYNSLSATGVRHYTRSGSVRGGGIIIGMRPVSFTGTLASTDDNDTLAASGTETFTGTLASTDAADTLAGSGSVANPVTGTLAASDGADTLAATGAETFTGTLVATDAADALAGSGVETFTGTLAATEASDTLAASGTNTGPITGTLAATETADTLSEAGAEQFTGTLAATEGNDSLAGSGLEVISGTLAAVEVGDTLVAVSIETISGTLGAVEVGDTLIALGTEGITGTQAAIEGNDTLAAAAVLLPPAIPLSFRLTSHLRVPTTSGRLHVPVLTGRLRVETVEGDTE